MINNLTESLNKTMVSDKDMLIKIEKDLEEIGRIASSQPCDCARIKELINSIQEKSKELSASLNKWTPA